MHHMSCTAGIDGLRALAEFQMKQAERQRPGDGQASPTKKTALDLQCAGCKCWAAAAGACLAGRPTIKKGWGCGGEGEEQNKAYLAAAADGILHFVQI